MAKLTAKDRKALPASTFAGPGRSFPIPDKGHAKAALSMIGNAPPSARPKIRSRAEAMLGGSSDAHHAKAHPGDDWQTHSRRHSAKSGKSGKFT